ncbi:unnamed protein product, partial [Iphiclides podalirius]
MIICVSCMTAMIAVGCISCVPILLDTYWPCNTCKRPTETPSGKNNCYTKVFPPRMICVSLLSLISAGVVLCCMPVCTRCVFRHKCCCPQKPVCPDCGHIY